jgi:hypothetical protein
MGGEGTQGDDELRLQACGLWMTGKIAKSVWWVNERLRVAASPRTTCTLSHSLFGGRLSGYQSAPSLAAMAFALPPVNCPDLHYPRSGISMAFLAHLQTFTWIAWILDREANNKGIRLDSTQQSWPPMRPRIMEPRGLVCGAWVGQRNKWTTPARALRAAAVLSEA